MSAQATHVWLKCELHDDGAVTGHGPDAESYEIKDGLVRVPQGEHANALLLQEVINTDFGGRYVIPAHAYRLATKAEIEAFIATHGDPADTSAEEIAAEENTATITATDPKAKRVRGAQG